MSTRKTMQIRGATIVVAIAVMGANYFSVPNNIAAAKSVFDQAPLSQESIPPLSPILDMATYDLKLRQLAHVAGSDSQTQTPVPLWPTDAVRPNAGALLPFNRIVAYYGNFLSTGMGVLGEYPPDEMIRRLQVEVKRWEEADPATPVVPAIDYIAVTAQLNPGADGKYRFRMPDKEIKKALGLAERVHGIVILEVQAGLSDVITEVKQLEPYLSLPEVHLAIDPEFAVKKSGGKPGSVVGTVDAKDVNAVADYLAGLVKVHSLPPKLLIVHRYTRPMVTHAKDINPLPEVQIVMDMDGWGPPAQKFDSYQAYIYSEPVQFTGFKLFYKNDVRRVGTHLLTPAEILKLTPEPSFIQYQ